jgi:hypothetical protein
MPTVKGPQTQAKSYGVRNYVKFRKPDMIEEVKVFELRGRAKSYDFCLLILSIKNGPEDRCGTNVLSELRKLVGSLPWRQPWIRI